MEIFKEIDGYNGVYQISNLGRVKSFAKRISTHKTYERILKNNFNGQYNFVELRNPTKIMTIHRLVALAFILNPLTKKCVNHKDGNKLNNHVENLEWNTHSENSKHGYSNNGRINPLRKLKDNQVLEIKKELKNYKYGMGLYLAKKYNVSTHIISLIKNNKTYL